MPGITKKEANKLGGAGGGGGGLNHPSLHQTGTKMEKMTSGHK